MTSHHGTHNDLHSADGALADEHPGRARNPIIKVLDLAWPPRSGSRTRSVSPR
jgi:hypothetical protein